MMPQATRAPSIPYSVTTNCMLPRLMGTDVARMVLTDEPFNVAIGGHVTGGEHREFVMASGETTDGEEQAAAVE